MFEAYKVGITIALTNKVSSALSLMGRDLIATDAKAKMLKGTLKEIKLLGISGALLGGAGYLGLHALDKSYEAAKRYEQAFNQFKTLNLGDAVNRQADKFARGANIMGASATDLMETARDLSTVLGDKNFSLVPQLAPGFAQLKFANQSVFGGHGLDFNRGQLRDLERIIEMKGGFKSAQDFLGQANMMQQAIGGTGGMVKPSDYLAFIKTSGVAGRLLSDKTFYYGMEPLIQEMGGARVGTATMSAYNNLAQGRATVRAAKEMMRLGIVDPSMVEYDKIGQVKRIKPGALQGMDEYTSSPYQWMKDVLLPAMAAKGITSKDGILNEMGALLGNRTASNLFSLMYLQQSKIEKNMGISQNAMGMDALVNLAKSSPQGAEKALGLAWENLNIAAGKVLIPIVIPALLKLADSFRALGAWIDRHPIRFEWLIKGFVSLAAAMAISGALLLVAAGFKAMGLALNLFGVGSALTNVASMFRVFAVIPFAGIGAGLSLVAAGLAAIAAIVYHKEIASALDKTSAGQKLGDWLYGISHGEYNILPSIQSGSGFAPPSANRTTQVNATINLDGRQIAQAVTQHQTSAMNAPPASGAGFDGRQSPIWPSSYNPGF